jgi:hypothetical protein
MEIPKIKTSVKEGGAIYHVFSFRPITKQELFTTVKIHISQKGKAKKGKEVLIYSTIGYAD